MKVKSIPIQRIKNKLFKEWKWNEKTFYLGFYVGCVFGMMEGLFVFFTLLNIGVK